METNKQPNQQKEIQINEIIFVRYIQHFQQLKLWQCPIWDDVLRKRDWSMLKELDLSYNNVKDEGLNLALKYPDNKLIDLNFRQCRLTYKGIQIMSNNNIRNLKKLLLSHNKIGNLGMKWLVRCDIPHLQHLKIVQCQIQSEGYRHMSKGHWPNLSILYLTYFYGNSTYTKTQKKTDSNQLNATQNNYNLNKIIRYA